MKTNLQLSIGLVALLALASAVLASDGSPANPSGSVRRILHLSDGSCLRAPTREIEGGCEVQVRGQWRRIERDTIVSSRAESDVLGECRARLKEIVPTAYGSRVEACRWMVAEGLDAEAADELDAILRAVPDERHALEMIATAPPHIDLECAPGANESARTALLRGGARQCNIGSSPVRREMIVRELGNSVLASEPLAEPNRETSAEPAREASAEPAVEGARESLRNDLLLELGSGVTARRTFACLALRRLCARDAIGPLSVHAVLDPSLDVRDGAILALRDARDVRACTAVVRALANPSPLVRSNAAEALGRMGYPEAVEPLIQLMTLASAASAPGGSGGGGPVRANLFVGLQTAYVQDYDVQIAQGASIADPIVQSLTTGVMFDVGVGGVSSVPISTELWNASRALVRLTGARIGVDPPAWKKWWDENRERFIPGAKRVTGTAPGSPSPTSAPGSPPAPRSPSAH